MWIKFGLFGIIALCLLPEAVISQGYCDFCNPSCNVEVDGDDRRLEFYNGALYYFSTGNKLTWNQANSACTELFQSQNGWSGPSANLASIQIKQEYNFIWKKLNSYLRRYWNKRSYIGGVRVGSEWKWTDGTEMNRALISSLWFQNQPSGDGNGMEIIGYPWYGNGLNDLSQSNPNARSYVCKIPCSSGSSSGNSNGSSSGNSNGSSSGNSNGSSSGTSNGNSNGSSDTCKCGLARRRNRIVGGAVTEVNEYPWQAGLTYVGFSTPFCGGSVIGDRWILTAAHCVYRRPAGQTQVILGEHDWTRYGETTLVRKNVVQIINHPRFNGVKPDYDYSLLKLDSAIDFAANPHIRPVCLPSGSSTYAGNSAISTGWGQISNNGRMSAQLKEVVLNVLTNRACSRISRVTSRMICAGVNRGGKGSCRGDSGGPLVSSGTGDGVTPGSNYELIGVTSFVLGACADRNNYPSVYARVTAAMTWINSNTGTLNTCPRT